VVEFLEKAFSAAHDEAVSVEVLGPRLLTKEEYTRAITSSKTNDVIRSVSETVNKFVLDCDLLICGYDSHSQPYIFHLAHPGRVTDYSNIGFHAIGSGAEKAISQLLFADYKRLAGLPRSLYECFDAKAHAEMSIGVGYEWDASFVTDEGPKE